VFLRVCARDFGILGVFGRKMRVGGWRGIRRGFWR
jgi:hypothetical protein